MQAVINVEVPKYDSKRQYDASFFHELVQKDRRNDTYLGAAKERAKTDPAFKAALVGSLRHYVGCPNCAWQGEIRVTRGRVEPCGKCEHWRAVFDVRP